MTFSPLSFIAAESRATLLDCKGHGGTTHCYLAVNVATVAAVVVGAVLILLFLVLLLTYFSDREP